MPLAIDIDADVKAVLRDLKAVERKIVPQAAARALNRVNARVRTRLVRRVQAYTGARNQKALRRQIKIPRFLRARANRLRAGALSEVYLPKAIAPHGAEVVFERGGPRRVGGEARFTATMPSGYTAEFIRPAFAYLERRSRDRTQRGGVRPMSSSFNLPIKEIHTDQTARVLGEARTLIVAAGDDWRKELTSELRYRLERSARRARGRR